MSPYPTVTIDVMANHSGSERLSNYYAIFDYLRLYFLFKSYGK